MNRLMIIGNLVADPQSNTTQDGKTVCNFTVAVNRKRTQNNQNPEADFFRVAAWHDLGKICQQYLAKGRKVAVIGSVSVSTYTAQDGNTRANMNVQALEVEFLSSRNDTQTASAPAAQTAPAVQPNMTPVDVDGELPF